jgi:hypothetical protein
MERNTQEYNEAVVALGVALRKNFPDTFISYDSASEFYLINDLSLFTKFDSPAKWQKFLGCPFAVPYFDDGIFGFFISIHYMN